MVSQLNRDFEDFKKYTEYIAEEVNKNEQRIAYLEDVVSDIKNVILDKKLIFKYLDDVDITILEQYIRKRKINKINK